MLGIKLLNPRCAAAAGQFIDRGVAFPQRDDMIPIQQRGKNLAKTPDAARIERS